MHAQSLALLFEEQRDTIRRMQTRIAYRPASTVATTDLVKAFNLAYRNYYRPLSLTTDSFTETVWREDVRLEKSVVALDGKRVVGMALLAVRPPCGWIGGVGVVPAYRRRGIARAMMTYLLDETARLSLRTVQLEVITLNHNAQTLYRSLGFEERRRLLILTRQPGLKSAAVPANAGPLCERQSAEEVLPVLTSLDRVTRAWSRDPASLMAHATGLQGYVARDRASGEPVGACLYGNYSFLLGLVTVAGTSEAGAALLRVLHAEHPGAATSYINIPAEDPLLPEFLRAGYEETLAQFEMFYTF